MSVKKICICLSHLFVHIHKNILEQLKLLKAVYAKDNNYKDKDIAKLYLKEYQIPHHNYTDNGTISLKFLSELFFTADKQ